MRITRKELFLCFILFGTPAVAWLASEVRWARINNPRGKFSSVSEYLAAGRLPSRVAKITTNSSTFFIAYSPMDYWLAVPSGAAAYVFDESGRMVTWSHGHQTQVKIAGFKELGRCGGKTRLQLTICEKS